MAVVIDADACPVKEIAVKLARQFGLPVTLVADTAHELYDGYSTVVIVDKGKDSVDIALFNLLKAGDLVITQDYGVAAMALGKGARVLNQNGLIFTNENISRLLEERHIKQKIRRSGGRTKGPAKRTKEDDQKFTQAFLYLLNG